MASLVFGRIRDRKVPRSAELVTTGMLRRKRVSDGKVLQTQKVFGSPWPYSLSETTWDTVHKGPPFKSGGPFCSIKATNDSDQVRGTGTRRGPQEIISGELSYWEFQGGFCRPLLSWELEQSALYSQEVVQNPFSASLLNSLSNLGPQAFDKLRPRIEEAGAAVFTAELRDLRGMLRTSGSFYKNWWESEGGNRFSQTMAGAPKKLSDHFLNHNFGWVPFISDLQKFFNVLQNQHQMLEQKARDNGLWIKRARTIAQDHSSTITRVANGTGLSSWPSQLDSMANIIPGTSSRFRLEQETSQDTQIWAKGVFTYYRPEFDLADAHYYDQFTQAKRLLDLYGFRINPSNLWKVTPWTWLVDWFIGFGQYLDRIQSIALDGVAAQYVYIMKRSVTTVRHTVTVNWIDGPQQILWVNKFDTKQREEAGSPFAYTMPQGGLSPKQLGILAALGITRWL